ncbi:MAG: FAD-dependent oxidoreductase [Armatimonadota bacterium]
MSQTITEPARETPIAKEVDVVVAGGGPAGLCAAVASARLGVNTLLIERYGFLGGMATAGLVNPFMNFHLDGVPIIQGVFEDWIEGMRKRDGYADRVGRSDNVFDPEAAKFSATELCQEAGVDMLLHSFVDNVLVEDGRIEAVCCAGKARLAATGQVFVDCTGDGDVATWAGCPFELGREEDNLMQPMTLNFNVGGVDPEKAPAHGTELQEYYDQARQRGEIDCPRENVLFFCTVRPEEIHFNTTRVIGVNGADTLDLTKAELEGRRQAEQFVQFLRKYAPGFENSYLLETGTQIGVRETRRIMGDYVLTKQDVLECRKFEDGICRARYVIDIHNPAGTGTVIMDLPPHEWYEIPYRCLLPKGMDNLLVAGRCIAADHAAHSSLRVMPIAAAIGEAAGTAAAMAVQRSLAPRELPAADLREQLVAQGANLVLQHQPAS